MFTEADAVAALPPNGFITQYCLWTAKQTDAPLGYHIGGALTALAVVAPPSLGIRIFGQHITANIFTMCAGRSGEDRKSTAVNMSRGLLSQAAPLLVGSEPASQAGLIDSLKVHPSQLITYSELGNFLMRAQDGSNIEAVKTKYNDLYDGIAIDRVKASNQRVVVQQPRLSLMAACAVPYLERYTDPTDWTGGFMSRWFVLHAHRERDLPLGGYCDPTLEHQLILELERRATVGLVAPCQGLDGPATSLWMQWYPDITNRTMPEKIQGMRSRAPTLALKLAVLLAWDLNPDVEAGNAWVITEDVLRHAIAITELHVRSVVAISDVLAESRDMRERRAVLRVLADAGGPMFYGDVIRASKLLKRRTHEIIDTLLEEGTIRQSMVDAKLAYVLDSRVRLPSPGSAPTAPSAPAGSGAVAPPTATAPPTPTPAGSEDGLVYWDDPTL